jgi:hypothetical protein
MRYWEIVWCLLAPEGSIGEWGDLLVEALGDGTRVARTWVL